MAVAGVIAAIGLSACGSGPGTSAPSITLYNGQHVQTTEALVAAFERQTGIQVNIRSDDEDVFANQIVQEGPRSPADVFFAENSPALEYLQERGLLAATDPGTLSQVPGRDSSPKGDWVGVTARVSVMIYNTTLLKPGQLPTSVMQLEDPRWNGKLALAAGETDFQPIVRSIIKDRGKAAALTWLQGVKKNAGSHLYPDNETVTDMVNKGQAAIGVINNYYWYREKYQVGPGNLHSAIAFFAPRDPGYLVNVSGAAVIRSSQHKPEAQRFLAFLVSRQGQAIIAHSQSWEYPLRPGVAAATGLRPFDSLQPAPLSIADLGDGSTAIALLQQAQLL
jgi:iron(III) transport system substrate-binding protein